MSLSVDSDLEMICIRVTGADRAKFLHNFCTHDIIGLPPQRLCEAFFTNVKARVLAHGYVLAGDDSHEIWMWPGDEQALLDHLNRYVITEDVQFASITQGRQAVAFTDPVDSLFAGGTAPSASTWCDIQCHGEPLRCVTLPWNETPVLVIAGAAATLESVLTTLPDDCRPVSPQAFDDLRIMSRYPLIGRDLTDEHLAPEALRNQTAISYTKGCYLGQEPIARLDAMGQVNRLLARLEIHQPDPAATAAVDVTSVSLQGTQPTGLAIVRADSLTSGSVAARLPDGTIHAATIVAPKSLSGDQ